MTAKDRVMDAVSRAALGGIGRPEGEQFNRMLVAFLEALLAEIPLPDEQPLAEWERDLLNAPELPKEPGRTVLATMVRGIRLDPPQPLFSIAIVSAAGEPLIVWVSGEDIDGEDEHLPDSVTEWVDARVVRDDEKGPAAALRRILAAIERHDIGCMGKLQGVEFAAREALKALGGEG